MMINEFAEAAVVEVFGVNLAQCHFVHHKFHMTLDRTQASAVGSR
jgi:hypothetical protein